MKRAPWTGQQEGFLGLLSIFDGPNRFWVNTSPVNALNSLFFSDRADISRALPWLQRERSGAESVAGEQVAASWCGAQTTGYSHKLIMEPWYASASSGLQPITALTCFTSAETTPCFLGDSMGGVWSEWGRLISPRADGHSEQRLWTSLSGSRQTGLSDTGTQGRGPDC